MGWKNWASHPAARRESDTNDSLQTRYPNIYAAGDVAGPYQFTHTAAHQAWYAAVNALFGDCQEVPRRLLGHSLGDLHRPGSGAGRTQRAGGAGSRALPTKSPDMASTTWTAPSPTAKPQGFVKVLTPPGRDRILGVTIVGDHAGDLIAEFVLAMHHGLGLNKILATIHIYPNPGRGQQVRRRGLEADPCSEKAARLDRAVSRLAAGLNEPLAQRRLHAMLVSVEMDCKATWTISTNEGRSSLK